MNMDDTKLSSRSEEVAAPAAVVVAVEVKKTAVAKDEKEEEVDRSESQAGVLQQKYFVSLVEKMIEKVCLEVHREKLDWLRRWYGSGICQAI